MRRAQVSLAVYFRIFEIIFLIAVIGIVAAEVKNIQDSGIYQKKFFARDIALLLDSVPNAGGNLQYVYSTPVASLSRFGVDFSNGKVSVDGEDWPYAFDSTAIFDAVPAKDSSSLLVRRLGRRTTIGPIPEKIGAFNGWFLPCGPVPRISSLIIDPGHNYVQNEPQLAWTGGQGSVSASFFVLGVSGAIKSVADSRGIPAVLTRSLSTKPVEETKSLQERLDILSRNDGFALSLVVGRQAKSQNVLKAFVHKDANDDVRGFACSILNAVAGQEQYANSITGTGVIPVDPAQLGSDDPRQVLSANKGIVIEIGSAHYPDNALLSSPQELGLVIAGVLQ
jgi:hypothetical protein